jgi:hypothetical protein
MHFSFSIVCRFQPYNLRSRTVPTTYASEVAGGSSIPSTSHTASIGTYRVQVFGLNYEDCIRITNLLSDALPLHYVLQNVTPPADYTEIFPVLAPFAPPISPATTSLPTYSTVVSTVSPAPSSAPIVIPISHSADFIAGPLPQQPESPALPVLSDLSPLSPTLADLSPLSPTLADLQPFHCTCPDHQLIETLGLQSSQSLPDLTIGEGSEQLLSVLSSCVLSQSAPS